MFRFLFKSNPIQREGVRMNDTTNTNEEFECPVIDKPGNWCKISAIMLLMGFLMTPQGCEAEEYKYKVGDKEYTLAVEPYDDESKELVHEYKLQTLNTSMGMMHNAANVEIAEKDIKPIITSNHIIMREGYTKVTDQQFQLLMVQAMGRFPDLVGVRWDVVKSGLARRDWARPYLKDGEFAEGEFLLHNTLITYWGGLPDPATFLTPPKDLQEKKESTE